MRKTIKRVLEWDSNLGPKAIYQLKDITQRHGFVDFNLELSAFLSIGAILEISHFYGSIFAAVPFQKVLNGPYKYVWYPAKPLVLCILTSKRVLYMPFSGQNQCFALITVLTANSCMGFFM